MKPSPSKKATKAARKRATEAVLAAAPAISDPILLVVVLMQENLSFDRLLGSMKSLYLELSGVDPNNPAVNREGSISYEQKPNAVFQLPTGRTRSTNWRMRSNNWI